MQIMQAIDPVRGPAYGTVPYVPPSTIIDKIVAGKMELWLHDGQRNGEISGRVVLRYLMENREILASCVRLLDLRIIQDKGLDFFRRYFPKNENVVILGATLQDYYPCLYKKDGDLELRSQWVEYSLNVNTPFLRVLS